MKRVIFLNLYLIKFEAMRKTSLLLVIILVPIAVAAQEANQLKWLVGTWRISTGNGYVVEQWKQKNDSTFSGRSMFVKASGDSTLQETIELSVRKGKWVYTPTIANQNNGQPVAFPVIFVGRGEFICENKSHDFPQRISYRRVKNNLHASIEGARGAKYMKQNFDFTNE
jgi:hypothetical protein